jgi:hypothetical protein
VNAEEHGLLGCWYQEFGYEDRLSGLAPTSFWPTRAALLGMLTKAGFGRPEVTAEEPDHLNGPLIGLSSRK